MTLQLGRISFTSLDLGASAVACLGAGKSRLCRQTLVVSEYPFETFPLDGKKGVFFLAALDLPPKFLEQIQGALSISPMTHWWRVLARCSI